MSNSVSQQVQDIIDKFPTDKTFTLISIASKFGARNKSAAGTALYDMARRKNIEKVGRGLFKTCTKNKPKKVLISIDVIENLLTAMAEAEPELRRLRKQDETLKTLTQ